MLTVIHQTHPKGDCKDAPYLRCFLSDPLRELGHRYRSAVIICPGGNYKTLSEREGEPVALRFQGHGFQSFVLHYNVAHQPYPKALMELADAVATVRMHAEEWDIDPERIFLCGFSAGGHLAASLAVHWNKPLLAQKYPDELCRPNGTVLCYPIIHIGAEDNQLLDELCITKDDTYFPWLSTEKHVSQITPPCFLWHNADDDEAPVGNALRYLEGLAQYGVPFESHIFPEGGHGLALADEMTAQGERYYNDVCAQWAALAMRWMERI